jgi:transcriptional regulator with XRE-family HTH domain
VGHSQESLAAALGVDRTTVSRWESGRTVPQPGLRPGLARELRIGLGELDAMMGRPGGSDAAAPSPSPARPDPEDTDDMIRRNFLRALTVAGALAALPPEEVEALGEARERGTSADFARMNGHLWQVFQLARVKSSVRPIVQDQLTGLGRALDARTGHESRALCTAAGDLFQLAGELAFDGNRYTDAAASYTLAATTSKDAGAFDLWACALVRHAYVDLYEHRYQQAADTLAVAARVAGQGDSALPTRYWVASVQAEAYAGLGDAKSCERARDTAAGVTALPDSTPRTGWLRFDGSRPAEERGSCYSRLGRHDLAERALEEALAQAHLSGGHSYRRRASVLVDLATISASHRDLDRAAHFGHEALTLARASGSGYVIRKMQGLATCLEPLSAEPLMAELSAEIGALTPA